MRNQVPSDPIVTIDQLVLKHLFVFFERGGGLGVPERDIYCFITLRVIDFKAIFAGKCLLSK